jgi:O-antigen/teichoic acid export membrane protein
MWVTINALVLMFGFANLGIGLGLMNTVARSQGNGDIAAERSTISSAVAVSLGIVGVLAVAVAGIFSFVPWASLLNVHGSLAVSEAAPSTAACIAMFLVGLPLSLSGSVWNGLQRTYVAYFFYGLGAILGLVGIVLAIVGGLGVPAMVLAASGGPVLANVLSGVTLFAMRPHLWPSLRLVSRDGVRALAGLSVAFFLVQVAMAVATSSDTIVLARVIGPTAVSGYSVVSRLYAVPLVLGTALITTLWPAITEARGAGDDAWIARTARRIIQLDLVFIVPLAAVLVLVGPAIAAVLTQGSLTPQGALFPAFAVATVMIVFASTVTVFLNSAGIVWPTAACWGVMAIANIALSVWLCSVVGASGVVWATAITEGMMLVPLSRLARTGGMGRTAGTSDSRRLRLGA